MTWERLGEKWCKGRGWKLNILFCRVKFERPTDAKAESPEVARWDRARQGPCWQAMAELWKPIEGRRGPPMRATLCEACRD